MALLLHQQWPMSPLAPTVVSLPPVLSTTLKGSSSMSSSAEMSPRNSMPVFIKTIPRQIGSRRRRRSARTRIKRGMDSYGAINLHYLPRQSSLSREHSMLKAINFDYSGGGGTGSGGGRAASTSSNGLQNNNQANNNNDDDDDDEEDLSNNPMAAYYNQLPPMMRKYNQQHKNKKPVYVSINQQTVNGLLSLLLLFMISICGSIGSIFLMSALTVIESLQTRGNSYLVSLALSHLLVTVFVIPSSALQIMAADGINSKQLCHYQWLALEFSLIVSQLSFFFIAIDNFLGYRSSEKLQMKLKTTTTTNDDDDDDGDHEFTTTNEDNNNSNSNIDSSISPNNNSANQLDWMAEARDFMNIRGQDKPDSVAAAASTNAANQLMSKQQLQQQQRQKHGPPVDGPKIVVGSPDSVESSKVLLTKQLVANQLPGCQEVKLLRSPSRGLIGYGNCCGRFRVVIWISLIWMLAISYTIHRHRGSSYGPLFCRAPNKYKPTNSSSNSGGGGGSGSTNSVAGGNIGGSRSSLAQPAIVRNHRSSSAQTQWINSLASGQILRLQDEDSDRSRGGRSESLTRRKRRIRIKLMKLAGAPSPGSLEPAAKRGTTQASDQLDSSMAAAATVNAVNAKTKEAPPDGYEQFRGSLGSLEQSATKALVGDFSTTPEDGSSHMIAPQAMLPKGTNGGESTFAPVQVSGYSNLLLAPATTTTTTTKKKAVPQASSTATFATFNSAHGLNEAQPLVNELDGGLKRLPATDKVVGATRAVSSSGPGSALAVAVAVAKQPISSNEKKRQRRRRQTRVAVLRARQDGRRIRSQPGPVKPTVQREIIWRTHCDSYHRNNSGSTSNIEQQQQPEQQRDPSSSVGVKQTTPKQSNCALALSSKTRKNAFNPKDTRPMMTMMIANDSDKCDKTMDSQTLAALDGPQNAGQVSLSGAPLSIAPSLPVERAALAAMRARVRRKRSPRPIEDANFNSYDDPPEVRSPIVLVSSGTSSSQRRAFIDGTQMATTSFGFDDSQGRTEVTKIGTQQQQHREGTKYFWPIMAGAVIGPSLISMILFAFAYLRMREFRQRSRKPLSLASIKLYPLPTSLLMPTSSIMSPQVNKLPTFLPAPKITTTVIATTNEEPNPPELAATATESTINRLKQTSSSSLMIHSATESTTSKPMNSTDQHSQLKTTQRVQHRRQLRSISQPVYSKQQLSPSFHRQMVSNQPLAQGFTRAEYIFDTPAPGSNLNSRAPSPGHLQQRPAESDNFQLLSSSGGGGEHQHQPVNHVFSVPLSQEDHSRYYHRERSTTQLHGTSPLIESPLSPAHQVQEFSLAHRASTEQRGFFHQLPPQQQQQQPVNLSYSAPPSATFVRYPTSEDLFDALVPMEGQPSDKRQRLSQQQQHELKRPHAQSFHHGTRLHPANRLLNNEIFVGPTKTTLTGQPNTIQCQQAQFARRRLPQRPPTNNNHNHQQPQPQQNLAGQVMPQVVIQALGQEEEQQQQHSLERHCSLPSSSRLYQSETGHLHLHISSPNKRRSTVQPDGSSPIQTSANVQSLGVQQQQQHQIQVEAAGTDWSAPVATSNVAEMSYDIAGSVKQQFHRNHQLQQSCDKQRELEQAALAKVIKPLHELPVVSSCSSVNSMMTSGADSPGGVNLPMMTPAHQLQSPNQQQQQQQQQHQSAKQTDKTTTTIIINNSPGGNAKLGEREKKLIVCAYPNMIDDQLLRSNIVVFALNLSLWLPFIIMSIVWQYRATLSEELKDTVWWMATLNCCSCSYVYALTHKDFRDAFNKLFYYCCCKSHVTFQRKTPIFRRQLDLDKSGNLRIHIIPGLNVCSNKLQTPASPLPHAGLAPNDNHHHHQQQPAAVIHHHWPQIDHETQQSTPSPIKIVRLANMSQVASELNANKDKALAIKSL